MARKLVCCWGTSAHFLTRFGGVVLFLYSFVSVVLQIQRKISHCLTRAIHYKLITKPSAGRHSAKPRNALLQVHLQQQGMPQQHGPSVLHLCSIAPGTLSAEGISPIFSKFDSPGINRGQCSVPLRHAQSTDTGKKTIMAEAADFLALFVTAPGLVLMQKLLCSLCNLLPSPFHFLAGLISDVAGTALLSHGGCWGWGGQLALRRWPWTGMWELGIFKIAGCGKRHQRLAEWASQHSTPRLTLLTCCLSICWTSVKSDQVQWSCKK